MDRWYELYAMCEMHIRATMSHASSRPCQCLQPCRKPSAAEHTCERRHGKERNGSPCELGPDLAKGALKWVGAIDYEQATEHTHTHTETDAWLLMPRTRRSHHVKEQPQLKSVEHTPRTPAIDADSRALLPHMADEARPTYRPSPLVGAQAAKAHP